MDSNWAADHLQVIRTIMERSAIYRRALAPVTLAAGVLGTIVTPVGWYWIPTTNRAFSLYWMGVSLVGLLLAAFMVRRQAWVDKEQFWSPPMRRVTQAMLPPLFAGMMAGLLVAIPTQTDSLSFWWLPGIWMVLYGCAVHSAGFFMPRGMKLLGWLFIVLGCSLGVALSCLKTPPPLAWAHGIMGLAFGGLHLAYGAYLYLTENRSNNK